MCKWCFRILKIVNCALIDEDLTFNISSLINNIFCSTTSAFLSWILQNSKHRLCVQINTVSQFVKRSYLGGVRWRKCFYQQQNRIHYLYYHTFRFASRFCEEIGHTWKEYKKLRQEYLFYKWCLKIYKRFESNRKPNFWYFDSYFLLKYILWNKTAGRWPPRLRSHIRALLMKFSMNFVNAALNFLF